MDDLTETKDLLPFKVGFKDRGHGAGDFAILDKDENLIAEVCSAIITPEGRIVKYLTLKRFQIILLRRVICMMN